MPLAIAILLLRRRRGRSGRFRHAVDLPPLIAPVQRVQNIGRGTRAASATPLARAAADFKVRPQDVSIRPANDRARASDGGVRPLDVNVRPVDVISRPVEPRPRPVGSRNGGEYSGVVDGTHIPDGATVRFERPLDQPVHLLPGRLEILEGADRGQDIRLFRIPGEAPVITIGRGDGAPYRHVKLRAQTVSRTHARLQYENGRWCIANLSRTNPLVVNGAELSEHDGARWLDDGDRIEMGEVVLRFRERVG